MKHFILTRFNDYYPGPYVDHNLGMDEKWLEARIALFKLITVPSVACQTDSDFTWILKCHPQTPSWARDQLKSDLYQVSYDEFEKFNVVNLHYSNVFSKLIRRDTKDKCIITTRLDNDDAISRDHIRLVKEQIQENKWFDFLRGIVKIGNSIFLHQKPHGISMFCSYMECRDELKTVYCKYHNEITREESTKDDVHYGWVQHHHDDNMGQVLKENKRYPNKAGAADWLMLKENYPSLFRCQFL